MKNKAIIGEIEDIISYCDSDSIRGREIITRLNALIAKIEGG